MKKFYITTAIDYPNAKPHLGHAYEKIVADTIARWHSLLGEEVFFLTGTDENSQKIVEAAEKEGKSPETFLEEIVPFFKELCRKLNVSNNSFIRTTDEKHVKVVQEVFKKIYGKGLFYEGVYKGLYCKGCEAFLTEKELVEGKCHSHRKKPEVLEEKNYFFKLSEFQKKILDHIRKNPDFILPESRRREILNRLEEQLKDLSISRPGIGWGIPLPIDKEHRIYVWFDALINYLSGIDYPDKKFRKLWPADVHIIGKDIVWFHSVIWPAILLSADLPLPKTVHGHGFLTVEKQKMSKALGNVIDPLYLTDTYGADALRYFLLREVPPGEDGDFSEKALRDRVNADLADALGNLLQRVSVLIHKHFNGRIPKPGVLQEKDEALVKASDIFNELNKLMMEFQWNKTAEKIWESIHLCNKYVNDTTPWKIKDKKRLGTVLYVLAECLRSTSILIYPFIPTSAERMALQLGQKITSFKDVRFRKTTAGVIKKPEILFKKLDIQETRSVSGHGSAVSREKESSEFSKFNFKVAIVEDVKQHPNADKLYVLNVDLGTKKRQLVAGLKDYYSPEELKGKHIVVVANLKPAKLRGELSQGMLLAAEKNGKVKVVEAKNSSAGNQVFIEGVIPGSVEISIQEFSKIKMLTKDGKVLFDEKVLKTKKEEILVDIGDGAVIR